MKWVILACVLLVVSSRGLELKGATQMMSEMEFQSRFGLGGIITGSVGLVVNSTKAVGSGLVTGVNKTVNGVMVVAGAATDLTLAVYAKAVNAGVAIFLTNYRFLVRTLHKEEIPLPDIAVSNTFVKAFNATGGFFRSLASLQKDGEILLKRDGLAIRIEVPMRFDDMFVGYRNYTFSTFLIGTSGNFSATVRSNKVHVKMLLMVSTSCTLTLEEVSVVNMEDIDVKFTGICSFCDSILGKMTSYVATFIQTVGRSMIENKLNTLISSVIDDKPFLCTQFLSS